MILEELKDNYPKAYRAFNEYIKKQYSQDLNRYIESIESAQIGILMQYVEKKGYIYMLCSISEMRGFIIRVFEIEENKI